MWVVPYLLLVVFLGWTKSKISTAHYVVTPLVKLLDEPLNGLFPKQLNLTLSLSYPNPPHNLSFLLLREASFPRPVVTRKFDLDTTDFLQCTYRASAWSFISAGLHLSGHLRTDCRSLSLCYSGVNGSVEMPPSSAYPNGAEFSLEPVSPSLSAKRHISPQMLRNQLMSPHLLTVSFHDGNSVSSLPSSPSQSISNLSTRQPNGSIFPLNWTSLKWNIQKQVDVRGLRKNSASPQTIHPPFHLDRRKRDARVTEDYPITDTLHVLHRPGKPPPHILELYMIVEESLVASFRGNYDKLLFRVNSLISRVNELFATFNINIVVVQLEIWEQNRIRLDLEEHHLLPTLAQFKRMHARIRHDCLHALLGERAYSLKRGSASSRTMCVFSSCVGYSRDSANVDLMETARIMAHELGHNFGLRHDTEECCCQSCIMATGVEFGNNRMDWSPCSMRDLPVLLQYGMGYCLHDVPQNGAVSFSGTALATASRVRHQVSVPPLVHSVVQVFDWQNEASAVSAIRAFRPNHMFSKGASSVAAGLCGNGVLDPGEECDCGTHLSCPLDLQDCCDVTRCKLKADSTCAGGQCCRIERRADTLSSSLRFQCRLAEAGTICRNVTGTCDLPEYCNGRTQWCPPDVYKADGMTCTTKEGSNSYCIRGGCRDSDSWCRVLWGRTGRIAHPSCFHENGRRNANGQVDPVANCGKRRPAEGERWEDAKSWPPIECASLYDSECGRLWCHHRNEKTLLLGVVQSETRTISSVREPCVSVVYDPVWPASDPTTWPTNNTRQLNWNAAAVDQLGAITQDAGMVPDGTPCSRGLCYNGSCITLAELPTRQTCNCRGPAICNNLGHCHCAPGFHAPYCEYGGDGGSIDSGPPPRDNSEPELVIAVSLLVFLGIPVIVLAVYCAVYHRCRFVLTFAPMVFTESGLQIPLDRGLLPFFRQCCRRPVTRSYTYDSLSGGSKRNSATLEVHKGNGSISVTNGFVHNHKSTIHEEASKKLNNGQISSSLVCDLEHQWQRALARSKQSHLSDSSSCHLAFDHAPTPPQQSAVLNPDPDTHNSPFASTLTISQPRLEAMTYCGATCSLPEAMSTLKQRFNFPPGGDLKRASVNKRKRLMRRLSRLRSMEPRAFIPIVRSVSRSHSQHYSPRPVVEISQPVLQTSTYNESLHDLQTARLHMSRPCP